MITLRVIVDEVTAAPNGGMTSPMPLVIHQ